MMRIGELRGLKWKDVVSTCWVDERVDSEGIESAIARIDIPAEICKTRKRRTVLARVGKFFDNVKRLTLNNDRNDYVFTGVDTDDQFSKKKLYQYWHELIEGVGLDKSERNLTPYSMRHWGITYRLLKGVSIWDVAKMAGTSVSHIERHYGHGEIESQRKMLESDGGGLSIDEIEKRIK